MNTAYIDMKRMLVKENEGTPKGKKKLQEAMNMPDGDAHRALREFTGVCDEFFEVLNNAMWYITALEQAVPEDMRRTLKHDFDKGRADKLLNDWESGDLSDYDNK